MHITHELQAGEKNVQGKIWKISSCSFLRPTISAIFHLSWNQESFTGKVFLRNDNLPPLILIFQKYLFYSLLLFDYILEHSEKGRLQDFALMFLSLHQPVTKNQTPNLFVLIFVDDAICKKNR